MIEVDGTRLTAFPEADAVAALPPAALAEVIRSERKAAYVRSAARAVATVDEAWLRGGPYEDVEAWLRAIDGVGAWSASFVLLRGLGRTERVPTGESRFTAAVAAHHAPASRAPRQTWRATLRRIAGGKATGRTTSASPQVEARPIALRTSHAAPLTSVGRWSEAPWSKGRVDP